MTFNKSIIPNSFTIANLVIGFTAILLASQAKVGSSQLLVHAGILIFVASFFDLFDGAAARALNVSSELGMQLDSLADAIAYGIAPAVISYKFFLYQYTYSVWGISVGMLIASIYPVMAIYRLAKFNSMGDESGSGFSGLPSPAAGIIIASLPTLFSPFPVLGLKFKGIPVWSLVVFYIVIALFMILPIDYSKIFSRIFHKGKVLVVVTIATIILLLIFWKMWAVFFVTAFYIVSGLIIHIYKKIFA